MSQSNGKNLSNAEFKELQDFIYQKSGMFFPLSRKNYIEQKIIKRMGALRFGNFNQYLDVLKKELIRTEIINLFNEITVNETFFFRDLPQLEVLEKHILPEAVKMGKKNINILSAGCSSGEEGYTLAIILKEKFPQLNYTITGIDISDLVVAKAMRAEYTEYAVRFVPRDYLKKYFQHTDSGNFIFQAKHKTGVTFRKFNLMEFENAPFSPFDVIFCRYVLIYFDKDSKQKVIDSFYSKIAQNGFLIMGNSESLFSIKNSFKMLHFPSAIIYNRK